MVRVGGGWDTLEHYLDKHDPCRCSSLCECPRGMSGPRDPHPPPPALRPPPPGRRHPTSLCFATPGSAWGSFPWGWAAQGADPAERGKGE